MIILLDCILYPNKTTINRLEPYLLSCHVLFFVHQRAAELKAVVKHRWKFNLHRMYMS